MHCLAPSVALEMSSEPVTGDAENMCSEYKSACAASIPIVVVVVVVMGARSELLRKPRPGKESLPGGRARVHPRTLCSSHGIPGSQQWK